MRQARSFLLGIAALIMAAAMGGCSDDTGMYDQSTPIANHNWSYANNIRCDVKITDASHPYNLYINLRVTGDYKYANLYVLLHTSGPKMKDDVLRYELHLADKTGQWLGSGSGNLYSYQIALKTGMHFPTAGTYHFEIEQNMRDNPLHEVSDVGLRVERAQ